MDSKSDLPSLDFIQILDRVYPVGSIYENKSDPRNPALILGFGTWVAIIGFTAGLAPSGTFATLGGVGGAETVTLTAAQSGLPAHTHQTKKGGSAGGDGSGSAWSSTATTNAAQDSGVTGGAANASAAHSNLPPYTTVAKWARTA